MNPGYFSKIRENTDNFHTDNIYQNYHTDKSILINFRKLNFTDKTQTDKIWKIDGHTDKTINFRITKLLIKKYSKITLHSTNPNGLYTTKNVVYFLFLSRKYPYKRGSKIEMTPLKGSFSPPNQFYSKRCK